MQSNANLEGAEALLRKTMVGRCIKKRQDHWRYRKTGDDGSIRITKVSMAPGEIHGHLWDEILKKQLQVDKEYFNKKDISK